MNDWFNWLVAGATLAWGVFGIWATVHALLHKHDPRSALGWSAAAFFLPYIGPLAYLLFGINRIGRHTRRLGILPRSTPGVPGNERRAPEQIPDEIRFINISDRVSSRPLVAGNHIETFDDGERVYAAMIDAIDAAKDSVMLATYIFRTDTSGRRIIDALAAASRRGLQVRVLVDGVGELYSLPRATRLLSKAGVRNARFIPLRLIPPQLHINLRNHRKLLIIDSHTAFTGGMNIGDQHVRNTHGAIDVVDMHFRLSGPIVNQLEALFNDDWRFTTGEATTRTTSVKPQAPAGEAWARTISDGPDDDLNKILLVIQSAISAARHSVQIMTPYFLPPAELITALESAALRGVDIDIVLPEKSNLRYIDWATRNLLWELLRWDINVYYQPPPFAHTKLLIIDNRYIHIGSANLDPRSLRLNFEVAVEIIDTGLGRELDRHITTVIDRSRRVTLTEVDNRSLPARIRDAFCWLFSPYL